MRRVFSYTTLFACTLLLSACGLNMYDQPKAEVLEKSPFFTDETSMRPIPEGTVSRNRGAVDPSYYTGQGESGFATELPFEVTLEVMERGQERYNIYCSPCHNFNGDGLGVIVQKGMVQPTSFHAERLREQPVGYFYNSITNGFGRMCSYASRIPPEDRWAISAYVKAMQLSQYADAADAETAQEESLNTTEQEASR